MTPMQVKAIDGLLRKFRSEYVSACENGIVTTTEIKAGLVLFKVETSGNIFTSQGFAVIIGKRGKITLSTVAYATNELLFKVKMGIK